MNRKLDQKLSNQNCSQTALQYGMSVTQKGYLTCITMPPINSFLKSLYSLNFTAFLDSLSVKVKVHSQTALFHDLIISLKKFATCLSKLLIV